MNGRWLQGRCKACCKVYVSTYKQKPGSAEKAAKRQRIWVLRDRYGITESVFLSMVASQGNACAICRETFSKTPHIDHDHLTGDIRGLLCQTCNHGIGLLGENIEVMKRAITYLLKSKAVHAVI